MLLRHEGDWPRASDEGGVPHVAVRLPVCGRQHRQLPARDGHIRCITRDTKHKVHILRRTQTGRHAQAETRTKLTPTTGSVQIEVDWLLVLRAPLRPLHGQLGAVGVIAGGEGSPRRRHPTGKRRLRRVEVHALQT